VSTPARTFTSRLAFSRVVPWPLQVGQRSTITRPAPPQCWQVRAMEKKPWVNRSSPVPPQVGQARGPVPGLAPEPWHSSQVLARGTVTWMVVPKAASSKPISASTRRSFPRTRRPPLGRPPPNISPKMSPKMSLMLPAPKGKSPWNPPPFWWPKRS